MLKSLVVLRIQLFKNKWVLLFTISVFESCFFLYNISTIVEKIFVAIFKASPSLPSIIFICKHILIEFLIIFLAQHFKKHKRLIPEKTIWKYFIQICSALEHMHNCRIMHRGLLLCNRIFLVKCWSMCNYFSDTNNLFWFFKRWCAFHFIAHLSHKLFWSKCVCCLLSTFDISISSPEPLGQFHLNLEQSILARREIKLVQIKSHAPFQGEIMWK